MKKEQTLNLESIKSSGLEDTLQKEIIDFKIKQSNSQHNSKTGIISLIFSDDDEKDVFFKNHFRRPTKDDPSGENLFSYHLREATYLNGIHNINGTLVPKLYGTLQDHLSNSYILFTECLDGPTSLDVYQNISKTMISANEIERPKLLSEKLSFLKIDLRQIAKFVGLCHANRKIFDNYFDKLMRGQYKKRQVSQSMRLAHYLRRTVHFNELGGREAFLNNKRKVFNERKVDRYIKQKKNIDVAYRVREIFKHRESVHPTISESQIKKRKIILQHGDCRLYHNFNGSFCDVEDFGYYPQHHDVVTFTSEEVVRPPVSELPGLLAHYLVYMNAYSSKSNVFTIQELDEVSGHHELERKLSGKISREDFSDFTVGYFAGILEDDILINGVRKKYSKGRLQSLADQYPGYDALSLQCSKLNHINDVYNFLTSIDAGDLFGNCNNRKQVANYFFEWGKLIEDLGILEFNDLGRLESIGNNDLQWKIYFGDNDQ